ncbi:pyruvate dehydrogenase (acetyl-transferring) E1 component subunit alpha [Spelaeicoccus albus]|uniref:Pyruvate dehydrogenase E1 component alpha subunit n=1 Tax=Spelaeicoccus albus TaxID=1280376 RepID=A0A7Z0CZJ0_9MICO|nr:pyruvate dehydrogenase (acetyl-transferring) E1 component subunit alpha [Spelaeicoccus albus]NYI66386.1 pyruvate dehydrogenase E1 component alpha subunit [Spelaeicoccus albus]
MSIATSSNAPAPGGTDEVPMVQLLTPEGTRVDDPEYGKYLDDVDDAKLRDFYRQMVLVRRVDNEGTALQRQGQLGLWAPVLGQEATQIGTGLAARPQDYIFPTYREHGVAMMRGVPPETLLGMFRGVSHGGWDPTENNFHLYTIVIASQTLHAVGYAMGVQRDGAVGTGDPDRDTAVMAFFGDGATSQGDMNEALVFAASYNAPVLFLCQNNQWAISEPLSRQTRIPLYRRGEGFGVPGVRVDGNDVLAVYAVTQANLERVRAGEGPRLVESFTYRMGAHTTADDPTKYRTAADVEVWRRRDPIDRLRILLETDGIADKEFFTAVDDEADELAARVRSACVNMPDPDPTSMFEHAYNGPHSLVDEEKAWMTDYLESFASEGEVD